MAPSKPPVSFLTFLLVVVALWKAFLDVLPHSGIETLTMPEGAREKYGYDVFLARFSTRMRTFGTPLGLSPAPHHQFGEALQQWNRCDHFYSVMLTHTRKYLES